MKDSQNRRNREANSSNSMESYIGIGQFAIGHSGDILRISALGSCIGVVIYPNPTKPSDRCAIMGHIMLAKAHANEKNRKNRWGPAKYADQAIAKMIKVLEVEGFTRKHFHAKMVGGAKMFGLGSLPMKIGEENALVVKELLKLEGIPIIKSFTGGDTGMAVSFSVSEYKLMVTPTGGTSIVL